MSYLVIARKFRPQSFKEVTGQDHVTKTLGHAIARDKVAHAYLLCGPRGVGKTSIARIFSKCLNCEKGPTSEPCLTCNNCQSITQGTNLAVREIDGASHNSVENVRELIEHFRSLPAAGSRYKIYIIDEVHMLSTSAFNALLKSLEEPPPHTIFILATTEPQKIPETVISRCQRHDLRALSEVEVEQRLQEISQLEKIKIDVQTLRLLARLADGSMRDAQSLLDRVQSFSEGAITFADASKVLGVVESEVLARLTTAIVNRNADAALHEVTQAFSTGLDPALFLREFVVHWREILIAKAAGKSGLARIGIRDEESTPLIALVEKVSAHDVQDLVQLAREGADNALRSAYPQYAIESLIVRMATREPVREIAAVLEKLQTVITGKAHTVSASAEIVRHESQRNDSQRNDSQRNDSQRIEKSIPAAISPASAPVFAASSGVASAPLSREAGPASDDEDPGPESEPIIVRKGELRWDEFVRDSKGQVGSMLHEQLKRLAVVQFSAGILKARGPDFSINYLLSADNKAKFETALSQITKCKDWKLQLSAAGSKGEPEKGSILHEERIEASESRKEKERDLSAHPKIKSLQKVFPGSTIDTIRIKE